MRALALLLVLSHCSFDHDYPVAYVQDRDGVYPPEAATLNGAPIYFLGWKHRF